MYLSQSLKVYLVRDLKECFGVAFSSKMVLCCSWEASCLDEAFGRKDELKLTTFKGLMLMYLFLMSLLELSHFRTSKKKTKNIIHLYLDFVIV